MARAASLGLAMICVAMLPACASNREVPRADLAAAQTTTIGVNSYLWRAALDTLSFAPTAQVDADQSPVAGEPRGNSFEVAGVTRQPGDADDRRA